MSNYPSNYETERVAACMAEAKDLLEQLSALTVRLDSSAREMAYYSQQGPNAPLSSHLDKAHEDIQRALVAVKEAQVLVSEQRRNAGRETEMTVYGLPPQSALRRLS